MKYCKAGQFNTNLGLSPFPCSIQFCRLSIVTNNVKMSEEDQAMFNYIIEKLSNHLTPTQKLVNLFKTLQI